MQVPKQPLTQVTSKGTKRMNCFWTAVISVEDTLLDIQQYFNFQGKYLRELRYKPEAG